MHCPRRFDSLLRMQNESAGVTLLVYALFTHLSAWAGRHTDLAAGILCKGTIWLFVSGAFWASFDFTQG